MLMLWTSAKGKKTGLGLENQNITGTNMKKYDQSRLREGKDVNYSLSVSLYLFLFFCTTIFQPLYA